MSAARGPAGGAIDQQWTSTRRLALDNLKVLLIAAIIAIHGVLSYAGTLDVWLYTEVREVTLSPLAEAAMFVVVGPFAFFMIALLFLVAGLLSFLSLQRKGPAAFARGRLLRLGVPFVVYVALLQPPVVYALERPLGVATRSYWHELLGSPWQVDMGPLWFVGVLLVFSLAYAAVVALRGGGGGDEPLPREIRVPHLLALAAVVAAATFVVRLRFRVGGEYGLEGLNFWEWPACVAAFSLGVLGARRGWLDAVPDTLFRRCRAVTLAGAAVFGAFMALGGATGFMDMGVVPGGATWAALGFVVPESVLTVFGPVWLLGIAQRRLNRELRWVTPAVRRSAFGAFVVQVLVLTALAVAARPLPVPAEVKALLVAGLGVLGSFWLAWLLIRRVPGVSRVL